MENPLVTIVKELAYEGNDAYEIQKYLESKRSSHDESLIKEAQERIDIYVVDYQLAAQAKEKALHEMMKGAFLFILGLSISVYTYVTLTKQYYLLYGAILGGAWLMKEGVKKYRLPIDDLVPRQRIFKRR